MRTIDRRRLLRLVERAGAQIVEVLPREEFDREHLAGARSVPLGEIGRIPGGARAQLDRGRAVVTYCYDSL